MIQWWILDGKEPKQVADVHEWERWYSDFNKRRVALDEFDGIRVSTVFLGIDHNFRFVGPEQERIPVLFETMVFGGPMDQEWCDRYCTWDEAEAGHKEMVERVKEAMVTSKDTLRNKETLRERTEDQ
jgi:hypothetical protein